MHFELSQLKKIKNKIFPVYEGEYTKFFLLAAICFLVCTNYTLLRTVKETLVITKPEMGLQIIPFLRTWMLMPVMLFFVKVYAVLSSHYKQSYVCYSLISFFLIFFFLFTVVLYPFEEALRLDRIGNWISSWRIPFAEQFSAMFRFWSFSLYYCLSEVWGTLVVLILFWGTSNRVNNPEEAKRFYSPILLITNVSGLFAAQISLLLSQGTLKHSLFSNQNKWSATLLSITSFVCVFIIIILFLFYFLFQKMTRDNSENKIKDKPIPKEEMSLLKMITYLGKNKNFLSLAVMVFAYFFTSGIMELVWKFYLQKAYPNSNDFNDYLSLCTQYISIFSTLLALSVTGGIIRRFPWRISALITPILLFIPLIMLTIFVFLKKVDPSFAALLGASYFCLSRICKFTFFDLSKEIATVELSYEDQIKSKTILDGLILKFAKTAESSLLQILLIIFGSISIFIPSLMILMLGIHFIWAYLIPERKQKTLMVES